MSGHIESKILAPVRRKMAICCRKMDATDTCGEGGDPPGCLKPLGEGGDPPGCLNPLGKGGDPPRCLNPLGEGGDPPGCLNSLGEGGDPAGCLNPLRAPLNVMPYPDERLPQMVRLSTYPSTL